VKVSIAPSEPEAVAAGLLCVGLFAGGRLPPWLASAPGAGDACGDFRKLALLHPPAPSRVLIVGLGPQDELDPERTRVAAALAVGQARRLRAGSITWDPPGDGPGIAAALTEGTILAAYSFERLKGRKDADEPTIEELTLLAEPEAGREIEVARVAALAANRSRDLQNLPANIADPAYLTARAEEIAGAHDPIEVEVLEPKRLAELGMGGLLAVAAGSEKEPAMIVLRYSGGGDPLCVIGKAVTFDSGGISIKPAASMHEMKMDMSGGAAALEATAAIAELGMPIDLLTVIPAVENMPSGGATRPGDVITQYGGTTVEVNNTDAEGRLILADALAWAAEQGATRIIDLATLTGAVVVGLGSTYAALLANDDALAARVAAAGESVGELVWRLPLHDEYREMMRGTVADLRNASPKRKAGTITAAAFLEEFAGEAAWAHLDIAGTSWDVGREYVGKGPTGFGTRLLVELADSLSTAARA
jgi:leucyl aminopeptidase